MLHRAMLREEVQPAEFADGLEKLAIATNQVLGSGR